MALLIFGPKKLPEIARQVGKALNEFKRASNEFKAQIESEISQLDMETATARSASVPSLRRRQCRHQPYDAGKPPGTSLYLPAAPNPLETGFETVSEQPVAWRRLPDA